MPVTKINHGALIILDVGRNVSEPEEKNEKCFFVKSREFTARLIERKIMSQGNNLLGIILLGSKKTKNIKAEQTDGAYKHIELFSDLVTPTWKMIRDLPTETTQKKGDWKEALLVAIDHFQNGVSGVKIENRKIILITNFQGSTHGKLDSEDSIFDVIETDHIELDIIGPDVYSEHLKGENIELARKLLEVSNGATATFDQAMNYLLFNKKKATKVVPWNVDLSIGPNLKIPISSYIRLKDEPVVKRWIKAVKDPVTSTASTTEGVEKVKTYAPFTATKAIKGYHYGQQVIPLSESDESMLYNSGEKCLSVYGFTDANNIQWQCLNGDGLSYIFGRKGDKKAQYAIRCLVECLHELKLVGLVRKVHNKGNAPKMFALMPVLDSNNYICLSMAAVCFKDEIKYMSFPSTSLKKFACTDVQVNAFKDLIKSMDLTKAYDETFDDTEAFPVAEMVSPSAQYVLDCIAFRALNPGKPLPQPRDEIMSLFKVPPMIEKNSREPLEKIKKLFVLNKVEKKTRKIKREDNLTVQNAMQTDIHDMPKVQLPVASNEDAVQIIGTIDPIGDYKTLTVTGKTLAELFKQMTDAIESLVYCDWDGTYSKALDAMSYLRVESVKDDPTLYNNWLLQFKAALKNRNKNDALQFINEKNLNFILKSENNLSAFETEDSHEDSQLYENETQPELTLIDNQSDDNIFDEM